MTYSVYNRYSADAFITILRLFDKKNRLRMDPVRQSTMDPEFYTPPADLDLPHTLYPEVSIEEATHLRVSDSEDQIIILCYEIITVGTLVWINSDYIEGMHETSNHVGKVKHIIYNELSGEWCIGYAKPVKVNRVDPDRSGSQIYS